MAGKDFESRGERIRRLREEEGYTRAELAEKIGISETALSKWEGDKQEPTKNLFELTEALEVSKDYILNGKEPENPDLTVTSNEYRLIKKFRALPGARQRLVSMLLSNLSDLEA